jgi:predicted aconitase with swiveling domain
LSDVLVAGNAEGEVLALDEPLSFWGGVHEATGVITDVHHPQHGLGVAGRVLVMPAGRGSSSSSSVLAELIRAGVGPAAIKRAAMFDSISAFDNAFLMVITTSHTAGLARRVVSSGRHPKLSD